MKIQLDKISNAHVYNMVIPENGVKNGSIVARGDYADYDTYKATKPADVDAEELVMLVAPFMNVTGLEKETDMTFKKDEVIRGYALTKGDIVTVTIDGITSATNVKADMVGKYVEPTDGAYVMTAGLTIKTATLSFYVIAVEQLDGTDALVLEVR